MDEGLPGLVRADVGFAAPGVRASITPEQNRATEWRSPCAISIQSFLTSPARAGILGSGICNNVAWHETSSAVAPSSWRPSSEMHDAEQETSAKRQGSAAGTFHHGQASREHLGAAWAGIGDRQAHIINFISASLLHS